MLSAPQSLSACSTLGPEEAGRVLCAEIIPGSILASDLKGCKPFQQVQELLFRGMLQALGCISASFILCWFRSSLGNATEVFQCGGVLTNLQCVYKACTPLCSRSTGARCPGWRHPRDLSLPSHQVPPNSPAHSWQFSCKLQAVGERWSRAKPSCPNADTSQRTRVPF